MVRMLVRGAMKAAKWAVPAVGGGLLTYGTIEAAKSMGFEELRDGAKAKLRLITGGKSAEEEGQ